jgi:hypothetical protein
MPTTVAGGLLEYRVGAGAFNPDPAREYSVGVLSDSTSSAVSVAVHSVAVLSGASFLDGNTVTDDALKAMLTATILLRSGRDWVTRLEFAAAGNAFQYVPLGTSISLEYVIKHSRGSQHRFRKFAVSVRKFGVTVTPIPEGGLAPVNLSQPPYADTPYTATPPTYSNTDPDAVSIYSSDVPGVISLRVVELEPAGEQFRSDILITATNSSHLSFPTFTRKITEFGYIMRPFDPGGGYGFNGYGHPAGSPWNYNVAEVEAFLAGGYTLPYNSGTTLVTHNNTWTMEVTEPTQLCGVAFCNTLGQDRINNLLQHALAPHTIKYTPAPLRPPRAFCSEPPVLNLRAGRVFITNREPQALRENCAYEGSFTACDGAEYNFSTPQPDKALGPVSFSAVASLRWFFAGDALWVSENGAYRDTLTITGFLFDAGARAGTYSLDGDDDASTTGLECLEGHPTGGSCSPLEVTVNVPAGQVADSRCNIIGSFSGGDVVLPRADTTNGTANYKSKGCVAELYLVRVQAEGTAFWPFAFRGRDKGCDPWSGWGTGYYTPGSAGAFGIGAFAYIYDSCPNGFTLAKPIAFVQAGESLPAFPDTAAPPEQTVPAGGGTATVQFCCPTVTESHVIVPSDSRYPKYFSFQKGGATATVIQQGRGANHCPFTIAWLSGITTNPFEAGLQMFASDRCPIKAQINHVEWPPCDWSVASSAAWLIAEKIAEEPELEDGQEDPEPAGDQVGLLKLSINPDDPTVFSGTFRGFERPFRSATITITSGATVNTWTIIQLQP